MQLDQHDEPPVYEFGYWPELCGVVIVVSMIAFLIICSDGVM